MQYDLALKLVCNDTPSEMTLVENRRVLYDVKVMLRGIIDRFDLLDTEGRPRFPRGNKDGYACLKMVKKVTLARNISAVDFTLAMPEFAEKITKITRVMSEYCKFAFNSSHYLQKEAPKHLDLDEIVDPTKYLHLLTQPSSVTNFDNMAKVCECECECGVFRKSILFKSKIDGLEIFAESPHEKKEIIKKKRELRRPFNRIILNTSMNSTYTALDTYIDTFDEFLTTHIFDNDMYFEEEGGHKLILRFTKAHPAVECTSEEILDSLMYIFPEICDLDDF
ncbi:hypothetical protein AX774_g721 [Zancudomyces culisetae]|uniref:Uncharacterized protein n=1 Tax=Zancudomyces culisetae TaxID=1213189 RepID=A0A1R1PXM7_ZANCU|nr:hypothetical protein AX774_g721 [Zancudomyces culisetae]|eukprot:OMH85720.1 hypothetical protein AX774_g721 [Zancudomyces culisetae]